MSRKNRIGGIYARPIGLGNLLFFASAALALGKAWSAGTLPATSLPVCVTFSVLAVGFAWLVFVYDPLAKEVTAIDG